MISLQTIPALQERVSLAGNSANFARVPRLTPQLAALACTRRVEFKYPRNTTEPESLTSCCKSEQA